MKRNDPVTITPCANGFIVEPLVVKNQETVTHRTLAFDSHGDLMNFLLCHFFFTTPASEIYDSGNQTERE